MDMHMKPEDIQTSGITWDCEVKDGIVPIVTGSEEDLQCATIAAFIIKGTIPQLEDAGVPWPKYLTNEITFGELDFYIRDSLQKVEKQTFYPQYDIENGRLIMNIGNYTEEGDYSEL